MDFGVISYLISLIISVVIISPILWIAGRSLVSKDKAKFTDAIWIVFIGVILGFLVGRLVHGLIGIIISLLLWVFLIKHFFDAGWVKAILISIVAVLLMFIIVLILAFFGITIFSGLFDRLPLSIPLT